MNASLRKRESHIWAREANEHYVEPAWCSERLFAEEEFTGLIHDPCCGFGTIPEAAARAGLTATATDLIDRGYQFGKVEDFLTSICRYDNMVFNPPFNIAARFVRRALDLTTRKVAIIFPTARLNAAHWMKGAPLRRVWLLSPRPSMPPGHIIAAGKKATGGKQDFCWLIFERGWDGTAELRWLYRDGGAG